MNIDIDYIQNKYNIKILKQNDELLFCCSDIGKMLELKNIRSSICKLQKKKLIQLQSQEIKKCLILTMKIYVRWLLDQENLMY